MRILLEENIPLDFASQLPGHEVSTVPGLGWNGVLNGELIPTQALYRWGQVILILNAEHMAAPPANPALSGVKPSTFSYLLLASRQRLDRQHVAIDAEADDDAGRHGRNPRVVAKRLARMDVGDVQFDHRHGRALDGVV